MKTSTKTYAELIHIAQCDQKHTALEESSLPIDKLPMDLLTALVDSKVMRDGPGGCGFSIVGFKMVQTSEIAFYVAGRRIFPENGLYGMQWGWIPRRRLGIWFSKDRQFRGEPDRYVKMDDIETKRREFPCWVAILTGNGVVCENWLRDTGFESASNGSPAYCNVREATDEEVTTYRNA